MIAVIYPVRTLLVKFRLYVQLKVILIVSNYLEIRAFLVHTFAFNILIFSRNLMKLLG